MSLAGFVTVGVLAGTGALMLLIGLRGGETVTRLGVEDQPRFSYPIAKQFVYPIITFFGVLVATGWWIAAAILAVCAWTMPRTRAKITDQAEHVAKSEALAAWVDMLRDSIVAGGGIEMPLRRTATTGPEYLRPSLVELVADTEAYDTQSALVRFAARTEHHIADMLVAAYSVAVRESTADLPDLLTAISTSAREEVETFRKVEVSRKKITSSMRMIIALLLVAWGGLAVFASEFLTAYDGAQGQVVLLVVGLITLGSYLWIQKLQIVRRPPRFFAVDTAEGDG